MSEVVKTDKTNINADIIVLGCNLPGMVTAHKLRKKFGDSMDIVVLDLPTTLQVPAVISKCNVAFKKQSESSVSGTSSNISSRASTDDLNPEELDTKAHQTMSKKFLSQYCNEFKVPIPSYIITPTQSPSFFMKIFEYSNGSYVTCENHYNDFDYLNFIQKFELNQYQNFLDESTKYLFGPQITNSPRDRKFMLYYDQTSMESSICANLFFSTSREIMRTTVKLVCGEAAHRVSALFFLHQCYRTSGTRNHLDGQNTRHREKLLGYCRKRITFQLQENIADITMSAKSIKYIGMCSNPDFDNKVFLETIRGDTTYFCSSLAMALKPEQLEEIEIDKHLLSDRFANIIRGMRPGKTKKFLIQYTECFWEKLGYSGDILSVRGPIIWAMSQPKLSLTGSVQKYPALIGYLMVKDDKDIQTSKLAVIEQLTRLFGPDAASPVGYIETNVSDITVPNCGEYEELRVLTTAVNPAGVEWAAIDVFADGDVAAALEAGHTAYRHLLSCFRPQAQTFEDICTNHYNRLIGTSPFTWWATKINIINTIKCIALMSASIIGIKLIRSYVNRQ